MALPRPAPTLEELIGKLGSHAVQRVLHAQVGPTPGGQYRHWDTVRRLSPPNDLTTEQWWFGIKLARASQLRRLDLTDAEGLSFVYSIPDEAMEQLHYIDKHCAGEVSMPEVVTGDAAARRTYLVNSLIEEAIRSSQLEGANTTRKVAKEMLRTGRPPRDRSERMIANNYRGLEYIREEMDGYLTAESVLELHRILTEDTLDNPDAAGRLQRPDEERVHVGGPYGEVAHTPPPAAQLPKRLELMCRFANGELPRQGFIHPVVRVVLLHFWLAYDHPFEDGNGRTARALFYWCMRREGYWLTEYLSISKILRQAPAKYGRSFLFTESDERDTTYFLLYHLEVIVRATHELQGYLQRKIQDIREVERHIRRADHFNYRQLELLKNAMREPSAVYTFVSHARSHQVTHQTARTDLLDLERRGLLVRHKVGRKFAFSPPADLLERLR